MSTSNGQFTPRGLDLQPRLSSQLLTCSDPIKLKMMWRSRSQWRCGESYSAAWPVGLSTQSWPTPCQLRVSWQRTRGLLQFEGILRRSGLTQATALSVPNLSCKSYTSSWMTWTGLVCRKLWLKMEPTGSGKSNKQINLIIMVLRKLLFAPCIPESVERVRQQLQWAPDNPSDRYQPYQWTFNRCQGTELWRQRAVHHTQFAFTGTKKY